MVEGHGRRLEGPNYHAAILACAVLLLALACGMKDVDGRLSIGGFLLPTVCPLKNLTGFDCPSCGATRSLVACCHGRFADAARRSPVGVVLFAILLAQLPLRASLLAVPRLRRLDTRPLDLWTLVALLLFALSSMACKLL